MPNWSALHRQLWQAVQAHEARLGETTAEYVASILDAIRAGGQTLTAEAEQQLSDYLDAADGVIRDGIERAVAPVAEIAGVAAGMRSEVIARATADAYGRRWPDGLTLSRRVWRWQEATRQGVSAALADGVRLGRATGTILMDMQRAIEAVQGERFAFASVLSPDWVTDLEKAAKFYIRTPSAASGWKAVVREAQDHIGTLKVGGTRRQAEHVLDMIRDAVEAGRADLVDKHVGWWLYDRQQYALRRIVRTEMSTAAHRAVIAVALDDQDVTGFKWTLSASHPEWDVCDVYADVDLGMGKGVYPRDQVPAGKAHPHCMCALVPTTRKKAKEAGRYSADELAAAAGGPVEVYDPAAHGIGDPEAVADGEAPRGPDGERP